MFVFWVVGQKIEAKCWVKNWTALLALICSPGSPQDILGAAGFNRERERESGVLDSSKSPGHDLSQRQAGFSGSGGCVT